MANGFQFWAEQVRVVRRLPGKRDREWKASMVFEDDHGVVEYGTDITVGDEVHRFDLVGRLKKPAKTVGSVEWEARSRLSQGVVVWASPILSRAASPETAPDLNLELHGYLLLDWLYERRTGDEDYSNVDEFTEEKNLPSGSGRILVQHLGSRALVDSFQTMGGPNYGILSVEGIGFVQNTRVRRADHAERVRALRQKLLQWLYKQEYQGIVTADWNGFANGSEAHFLGETFSEAEIVRAIRDLVDRNLVTGVEIDQADEVVIKPQLTTDGRDCVIDFGGNVSDYINRQPSGTTNNITLTNVEGQTVIASNNVTQNMATELEVDKLLAFAGFVDQVLPTLGLTAEGRDNLRDRTSELHAAASGNNLDRSRLRRLVDAVVEALSKAAPSIVTTTAIEMGQQAIKAITG